MKRKTGLGRGLGALLGDAADRAKPPVDSTPTQTTEASGTAAPIGEALKRVPLDQIETNPYQPRRHFDQEALAELADSIREHGLIQPVTLRRLGAGRYQIIAGERRCQASRLVGLETIPAQVRQATDQQMLEVALIENIQRAQLGPLEVAASYQRLMTEVGLTQEQLSERVHKSRVTITNTLRLLKLPPAAQQALEQGAITTGHAKALLSIQDPASLLDAMGLILRRGLSVRQAEALAALYAQEKSASKAPSEQPDADHKALERRLTSATGLKVALTLSGKDRGHLRIPFQSLDDLDRIIQYLDPDA